MVKAKFEIIVEVDLTCLDRTAFGWSNMASGMVPTFSTVLSCNPAWLCLLWATGGGGRTCWLVLRWRMPWRGRQPSRDLWGGASPLWVHYISVPASFFFPSAACLSLKAEKERVSTHFTLLMHRNPQGNGDWALHDEMLGSGQAVPLCLTPEPLSAPPPSVMKVCGSVAASQPEQHMPRGHVLATQRHR